MQRILIPVTRVIIADTDTPISIFSKLKPFGAQFLLESAERGEQFGRFSIIALNPKGELVIRDGKIFASGDLSEIVSCSNPFDAVSQVMDAYKVEETDDTLPFIGGVMGFFAYDCLRYVEDLPNVPKDDIGFPD